MEVETYCKKADSEIEDLIPPTLLIDWFDRLFRSEDGLEDEYIDISKPIVPQLENQLDLKNRIGWKVELSKKVKPKFNGQVDEELVTS